MTLSYIGPPMTLGNAATARVRLSCGRYGNRAAVAPSANIVIAANWQYEYATDRADRGEAMRTSKTINRILRSQEPGLSADEPMTSCRCQFCGRRFTDRTELREHLEVEQQRQAGFAGDAWDRGPDRTGGR